MADQRRRLVSYPGARRSSTSSTRGSDHVIVEPDRDPAATFRERGLTVVHGDPESTETILGACIETADYLRITDADIRNRTGCTVIAIDREGEVLTDVGPETTIEAGDTLVVAGTDEAMVPFGRIAQ